MILDTIDKFSQMEAMPDFAVLLNDNTQVIKTNIISLILKILIKNWDYLKVSRELINFLLIKLFIS